MPTITILDQVVALRFTLGERIAGLLSDVDIPLQNVRAVSVVPDGLAAARGLRAPGLGIPGRRKIGTWRRRGSRSLVAVVVGRPALVLELTGHRLDKVVVSDDQADIHAEQIRRRVHPSGGAR